MATILPPTPEESQSNHRRVWHEIFDPHFDTLVAWGYVDGCYPLSFGSSVTGITSTDGEIAFREGTFLGYGADLSADTIYIVSSSASDTQTYSVQGIDANGDYQVVTVTATGTTPAALTGTWDHVQRFVCTDGVDNVGTVYLSTKSGAGVPALITDQIQCVMLPGENYGINPLLVVPNGQVLTINDFDFSQDANQSATVKIFANRQGRWIINFKFFAGNDDHFAQTFHTPLRFFEGDKLKVTIEAGGGTSASATFGMNGNVLDSTILDVQRAGIGEVLK